jgi:radical SAM superfamily enzyme YgiQ (UPF0313 family)
MSWDVLYIHPAKQEVGFRYDEYVSSPPYLVIPVGVIGLINLLRGRGLEVTGLNLPLEVILEPSFDFRAWLSARVPPRLVMIDLHWYEHSYGALDVARLCKRIYAESPVLLGGITASIYAKEILEGFPEVDFVIRGDAEEPLLKLVDALQGTVDLASVPNLVYREGGSIVEQEIAFCATSSDLDQQDFVDTDFLEHRDDYAAMQHTGGMGVIHDASERGHWLCLGRGCTFDCSFCGGGKAAQQKFAGRCGFVLRSVECVLDDMERLRDRDIQQISLSLDPAILGTEYWRPLFEGMQQRGIEIGLYNEFFQLPSSEFLRAFAEAAGLDHSEVAITVLSGDERVRRLNGKFFSNRQLFQVLGWLRRYEIPIFIYFSANLPGEKPETFRHTIDLARRMARYYPRELLRMHNQCHTVDPLSPLSLTPGQFGAQVAMGSFKDYYRYCQRTAYARRDVARGQWRGLSVDSRSSDGVEAMARQWDQFCAGQDFRCFRIPWGW